MIQRVGRTVLAGMFAVALMVPAAARGEDPVRENAIKARELRAQAEALFDAPNQWGKVARLLEESAALRPVSDPEKYECLMYAGRLRAGLGHHKQAHRLLESAAEAALIRGAIVEAADAYVSAAFAARDARYTQAAISLIQKATLLASSPLLSAAEKKRVLDRVS